VQNRRRFPRFPGRIADTPTTEAVIPTPDRIDTALNTHKRLSRMVSAGIVALGLIVLAVALLGRGRERERKAARVMVGDDSTAVARLLGQPPHRCPTSSLGHLTGQFEPGTPRPTIEAALQQLRGRTAQRWVYPDGAGCVPGDGDTELGLDASGRVLWIVPVRERRPLVYDAPPG